MRWQLTGMEGSVAGHAPGELLSPGLAGGPSALHAGGPGRLSGIGEETPHERLLAVIEPLLRKDRPNWVVLPFSEQSRRQEWEARLGHCSEIGFGRGWSTLALSQLNRLGTQGRLIGASMLGVEDAGVEACIALDWAPSEGGFELGFSRVDGGAEGSPDLTDLIQQGQEAIRQPELLVCPGTGSDGYLEPLYPSLPALGDWVQPEVRWVFPEASVGASLGVAGSLFNWAWLVQGYRFGEVTGASVVLALDEGPLAGLAVVNAGVV